MRIPSLIELAGFIAFVHLLVWVVEPRAPAAIRFGCYVAVVAYAAVTARAHGESARELGVRFDNIGVSAREVMPATLALAAAVVACGLALGSLRLDARGLDRAALYVAWALVQQYALQAIIHRRLLTAGVSGRAAPVIAAAIFSTAHIPNVPLVVFTFAGGWLWASWFRRNPNLFTLSASHALLAIALVSALPPDLMQNLRVGPGYLEHLHRSRVSSTSAIWPGVS